jgi:hypothetical protein
MATVRVRVAPPTARADGSPGAISGWQLQTRADAAPAYGNLGAVNAADVLERTVQNVSAGRWWFRAVFKDAVAGGPDLMREASIDIPLSALVGGTITLDIP